MRADYSNCENYGEEFFRKYLPPGKLRLVRQISTPDCKIHRPNNYVKINHCTIRMFIFWTLFKSYTKKTHYMYF